ncbi:MAG TPA: hypothetical protein VFQ65_21040 [Kofleriaceae bacterium]|nr:hypothetical protein [Kofleriaceae bacterium]
MTNRDLDFMEHADGELETELAGDGRAKVEAVKELGELVRGRLERAAEDVPEARFAAMWSEIDRTISKPSAKSQNLPVLAQPAHATQTGIWSRIGRFLDTYRSQIITGAISAGAVATLALVLRGSGDSATHRNGSGPIDVQRVSHRPAEIEALDTPGGTGTVFNLDDEDGSTTVIWVTPEDTVEGI